MAHHKSAKKRIVRNEARRVRNKSLLSAMRTLVKKVEKLITEGKSDDAKTAFAKAESALAKGVSKKIIAKSTASRKTSRLSQAVKKLK